MAEEDNLLIMTLNVNGIRTHQKVRALASYIASLPQQPDICVLTETHLTEPETDTFHLETYLKARSRCREEEADKACGGVLILVRNTVDYTKVTELPGVALPLNSCSIWLHLHNPELPKVRLTGVYFTPAAKPKLDQVRMLTNKQSEHRHEKILTGHLITGDLNILVGKATMRCG